MARQGVSPNCLFLDLVASKVSQDLMPWKLSIAQRWPRPDSSREGKAGLLPEQQGPVTDRPSAKNQGSPLTPFV